MNLNIFEKAASKLTLGERMAIPVEDILDDFPPVIGLNGGDNTPATALEACKEAGLRQVGFVSVGWVVEKVMG